jgi:nucleotide-binding universal stress UspA family protein
MLRFLVAIDHTVESTFSLRAACGLAREKGGTLEALHVIDPTAKTLDYGAGWAIHSYKKERLREAYADMEGVIASESQTCESTPDLRVVFGEIVKEIASEVAKGSFDFLFMGSVHPLEGPHQGILLKLLSKVPCPVIAVKHYRPLRKALLLVGEGVAAEGPVSKTELLLNGLSVHIDLAGVAKTDKETQAHALLEKSRDRLLSSGLETSVLTLPGDPIHEVLESAQHYDLVILGWRRPGKPDPLALTMLQKMPAPLMICP